jgi:hypothetical protein
MEEISSSSDKTNVTSLELLTNEETLLARDMLACFSCSPPDLNFLGPQFIFMYMYYNHCHRATAHLQFIIIIIIIIIIFVGEVAVAYLNKNFCVLGRVAKL